MERRKDSMATAVKTTDFEHEVLQSDTPVLVDFWAEWCGPCHAVSPILDKIASEREGALKLVKVNIDEEQELAMRYGVQSIPTMILFKGGEPAAQGQAPEAEQRQDERAAADVRVRVGGVPEQRRQTEEHRRTHHRAQVERGRPPQIAAPRERQPVRKTRQRRRHGHDQAYD